MIGGSADGLVLDDLRSTPDVILLRIELHLAGQKAQLRNGPVRERWQELALPRFKKEAPHDPWSKALVIPTEGYNPARVTFQLIREIYSLFGHSEESIPYTRDAETAKSLMRIR